VSWKLLLGHPVTCALLLLAVLPVNFASASATVPQHDIEVVLSVDSGEIRIIDRVRVSPRDYYRFQLAPWITLDEVKLNGVLAQVHSDPLGYRIELLQGSDNELAFGLSGTIPGRVTGGSSGVASTGDDGAYLPGYVAWIPHDLAESLRFRLRVTVPSAYRAVATGKLDEESDDGAQYQADFAQDQPGVAPALFVGPYKVHERLNNGLRLRTYFHSEIAAQSELYLEAASTYIQRYSELIGDYPYDGFQMVSAPLPVGLGFAGLTYIDRRIVPRPFMRARSLAHEVVHNWWGNAVAVDYASGNWAEGLTTYMADYALERDQGEAAARNMRVAWLRDYAALPVARDSAARDFRSKRHQGDQVVGYNKVAFIFHMLRQEIGQQAFDEGIRNFWRRHRFSSASWQDLQHVFELSADVELDWFFHQWVDQAGAPRLSLGSHQVEVLEDGYRTRIEILQSVSGYQFTLAVELVTETGVEQRQLRVEDRVTRLEWVTSGSPQSIVFDPQNDLFRRLQTSETPPILRDVTLDPATMVLVVGAESGFADGARELVERLLDSKSQLLQPEQIPDLTRPLLLIFSSDVASEQLARLQLEIPEDLPAAEHDAAAWTTRLSNDTPVLVVTADSSAALQALLRPLPHYGGQSYVLFNDGRAERRGLWPLARGTLFRDLHSRNRPSNPPL
jgi:aminopeptidase N